MRIERDEEEHHVDNSSVSVEVEKSTKLRFILYTYFTLASSRIIS